MSDPRDPDRLRQAAEEVFGWRELRPGQLTAMEAVTAARDTLVVMPTGAGKSAVYQVAALLLPGPTVVVSPLIALQRDQIAGLLSHRAPDAVAVNSAQPAGETAAAWDAVQHGDAEYLFLSPEQLTKDEVVERLARAEPSLFVVDEAQCVASWGHDFRPDYLRLAQAVRRVGRPTVLALTATAAPPVREEIVQRLEMADPALVVAGFDRPNIALEVRRFQDDADKRRAVVERAATEPKPGIVYAATRRDAEEYAAELAGLGLSAAAYHAGLAGGERSRVHDAFLSGDADVIVATSAFGMGIDKEDVRFVLHASVPGSLDAYYQEIGRAGRDGAPAVAVLHYRPQDSALQRLFATRAPDEETLGEVARRIDEHSGPVGLADVGERTDLSRRRVTAAANLLEQAGAVRTDAEGRVRSVPGVTADEAAAHAAEVAEARRRLERSRLEMVLGYAETTGCRRRFLLGYFGEPYEAPCGACDVCRDDGSPAAAEGTVVEGAGDTGDAPSAHPAAASFPAGTPVRHSEWGDGTVMSEEGDRITVLFESMGYRTLSLAAIAGKGLLSERAETAD
ncbi:RecQ family ATP-dependent DNA helicase [Streptomyces chromofuscus]|uniref:ATP-dependent DNA helicase RecQ n=1 Tax=Streptomyces chromofuscus TaxID=42881 RepID=A0A7M2TCE1_STRCW|nr:RecQ family ATP-dependent DNA helicase [Streptomyces chromofuscus]QOV46350.1 RecQ family ATP-dependent DNA helicase [Streptomyces chromofuscus]GGS95177.1 ATP-dependent DNA helicase RecQ [Streptomyces chromofuscus]